MTAESLTLSPSDSRPVSPHVGADGKRVPVAFDKGQHIVTHRQVRDVIPELYAADPVIGRTVHQRAVFEPKAPLAVLSPGKHPAAVPPRSGQLTFKGQKRNLKMSKGKTKPKHAQGRTKRNNNTTAQRQMEDLKIEYIESSWESI